MSDACDRGLEAFDRRKWADAYEHLAVAEREEGLAPGALEPFSVAAYLMGRPDEGAGILGRAHQEYLERGDLVGAARCARNGASCCFDPRAIPEGLSRSR